MRRRARRSLDPFQTGPDGPKTLLPPKPEPNKDLDEGAVVCGIILIILGVLAILTLNFKAGWDTIVLGVKLIGSAGNIDWQDLRCQLYWLRMYLYLGLKGLHQLLAIAAFEYPVAKALADDEETSALLGLSVTWQTGRNLGEVAGAAQGFPIEMLGRFHPDVQLATNRRRSGIRETHDNRLSDQRLSVLLHQ